MNKKLRIFIIIFASIILIAFISMVHYYNPKVSEENNESLDVESAGKFVVFQDWKYKLIECNESLNFESTNEFPGWKNYRNETYGFEFEYPEDWICFDEERICFDEEGQEEDCSRIAPHIIKLRPADKSYYYEGMEEHPIAIRVQDYFGREYESERKDLSINSISMAKFTQKRGINIAWETTATMEANNLGYYFEFFNPIYAFASGDEAEYLLDIHDKVISSFKFLK